MSVLDKTQSDLLDGEMDAYLNKSVTKKEKEEEELEEGEEVGDLVEVLEVSDFNKTKKEKEQDQKKEKEKDKDKKKEKEDEKKSRKTKKEKEKQKQKKKRSRYRKREKKKSTTSESSNSSTTISSEDSSSTISESRSTSRSESSSTETSSSSSSDKKRRSKVKERERRRKRKEREKRRRQKDKERKKREKQRRKEKNKKRKMKKKMKKKNKDKTKKKKQKQIGILATDYDFEFMDSEESEGPIVACDYPESTSGLIIKKDVYKQSFKKVKKEKDSNSENALIFIKPEPRNEKIEELYDKNEIANKEANFEVVDFLNEAPEILNSTFDQLVVKKDAQERSSDYETWFLLNYLNEWKGHSLDKLKNESKYSDIAKHYNRYVEDAFKNAKIYLAIGKAQFEFGTDHSNSGYFREGTIRFDQHGFKIHSTNIGEIMNKKFGKNISISTKQSNPRVILIDLIKEKKSITIKTNNLATKRTFLATFFLFTQMQKKKNLIGHNPKVEGAVINQENIKIMPPMLELTKDLKKLISGIGYISSRANLTNLLSKYTKAEGVNFLIAIKVPKLYPMEAGFLKIKPTKLFIGLGTKVIDTMDYSNSISVSKNPQIKRVFTITGTSGKSMFEIITQTDSEATLIIATINHFIKGFNQNKLVKRKSTFFKKKN
ncbi:serine/arginine repetitive matrix [Anaeramoeba flamelloides]|uniref:Serine/arginine repetitive matrix n=1 Tax=Anaeramoeba flamelloides TaxID=1746091 RepID=A0AAV7Y4L3_9EUKA|nr:serine/arginine repetitive matrix [Anaeramoeba flamelloides]